MNSETQSPADIALPFDLKLLGPFSLKNGKGHEIVITGKKNRALLAVLAFSPSGLATRDRICGLLWSDRGEEQARNSLRQSLAVLRRELGSAQHVMLDIRNNAVALRLDSIKVDCLTLQNLGRADDAASLRLAENVHQGELLADTSVSDPAFEEWLSAERRQMKEAAVNVLQKLTGVETGFARVASARRLVDLDSMRETSHRTLMVAYAETGELALALQQFETCKLILKTEFGVEPSAETLALRASISDGKVQTSIPQLENTTTSHFENLAGRPFIAVLPFQNMSGDVEQDYFADGMVEEITTALSRVKWLSVIARNSSFTYKGKVVDIKQVGRELGVRYVLEGSVRKAGNRIRITGQLIDAETGGHLWADRFDGDLANVFDLQDQVAASVVGAVSPKLELKEINRSQRKPIEDLDAYDNYLRGMAAFYQTTKTSNDEALAFFRKAIERDPGFAPAFGMAARCYAQRKPYGWTKDQASENIEAEKLARRAAEVGHDDAVALCMAGFALGFTGDLDGGLALIDQALVLNPNYASTWRFSGLLRSFRGESELAIEHVSRAMRLSPQDPQFYGMQVIMAYGHFFGGRDEEAYRFAESALRTNSNFPTACCMAAASGARSGKLVEADKAMVRLRQLNPTLRQSNLKDLLPLQRQQDLLRLTEALQLAGLPA